MSIQHKPNKWIVNTLLYAIRTYMERRSTIVVERNDTINLEPPYIILSNHVNNWDPLFINAYVKEPICFVAADPLFRHRYLGKVLRYVGAIPKTKFKNDTGTIRAILKAKKYKRAIAIFPEGNRNWDGYTEPFPPTTAKLVKSLHIPVIVAKIHGGHLSHPRWADGHRKGQILMSFTKLYDGEDLRNESMEQIDQKLANALHHDELKWQSQQQITYRGKKLANYLERLLFVCPNCEIPGHLRSTDDLLRCQNCDYTVRYTPLGTLEQVSDSIYFTTPRDWNLWQLQFMKESLFDPSKRMDWDQALQDHVKLFVSEDQRPFELIAAGNLRWNADTITFESDQGNKYDFSFNLIEGLNIQFHHKLDFFYNNQFYRIEFYQPHTSAYKWIKSIQTYTIQSNSIKEAE